jgi:acetyl-CoA acyltransferase
MAVILAGLPLSVPGATVNRLCGSGLDAVNRAAGDLALGHGDVAIAGGVEAMSRAPFVLPRATDRLPRTQELVDTALGWRLVNPKMPSEHTISLGMTAEVLAAEYDISREAQDAFALDSHRKAVAARDAGKFASELVPVPVGDAEVAVDEGPRADTSLERLAKLKPVFAADGTVTAGNSSPLNDGAAAVLLANDDGLARHGLTPLARIETWAAAGVEPRRMGIGPAPAMRLALDRAGWKLDDLEVVELNEAFAAQSLAVVAELGLDPARVNPVGGAIALGHPLGCSGARILTTLVHQLAAAPSGTRGAATMCIGVGQGIATLVERV